MRGASALDDLLARFPDAPIRVHVVWEPVLRTDIAPPTSRVLGLIRDRRATQYWDPERIVSADLVRAVDADPSRYGFEERLPEGYVAWDMIAVFPPSARWDREPPVPAWYGGPVVREIPAASKAIADALDRIPSTAR